MSHDPLSDVLRSVRLRGAVFYYVSFGGDWAAETPASPALADALIPGADHVLAYHLVLRGSCWAAADGVAPERILMAQRDIDAVKACTALIAMPALKAHWLAESP